MKNLLANSENPMKNMLANSENLAGRCSLVDKSADS